MDMAAFAPILEPKLVRNADEIASEEIREFTEKVSQRVGKGTRDEPHACAHVYRTFLNPVLT